MVLIDQLQKYGVLGMYVTISVQTRSVSVATVLCIMLNVHFHRVFTHY